MPGAKTWQMIAKSEMSKDLGRASTGKAVGNNLQDGDFGCSPSHVQSCNTSECSTPNFVYHRRRPPKNPALPQAYVSSKASPDAISFIYERRKHQESGFTNFFSVVSANTSLNAASSSSMRSENPMGPLMNKHRGEHAVDGTRVSSFSATVDGKELHVNTSGGNEGCPFDNPVSNLKDKNKIVELSSVDDSCSSSMLNMDGGVAPLIAKIDDTDECSSSGAHATDVVGDGLSLSVKTLCVSILQSHGLLNRSGHLDEKDPCSTRKSRRSCHVCGLTEAAVEMLICDECEEAFHLSCFNPSIKKIPVDDWYCHSCAKKKHNSIKERAVARSSIIRSGKGSVTSEGCSSPIELMLNDTQPYITGVRVGKGFQAIVPEWSAPMTKCRDHDRISEPTKLDPPFGVNLHKSIPGKRRKSSFIGNWLQCRDVINSTGGGVDGAICGKWRRAPLNEVQTDKWDCFCSILWDPTYADCSVPQELDTEEVLKQLKYIELLKPRLAAKRRKLEMCSATGANGFQAPTEGASVQTI